MRLGKKFSQTS
jgi:hypothetical protein